MKRYLLVVIVFSVSLLLIEQTFKTKIGDFARDSQSAAPLYFGAIFSLSGFGAIAGQGELNGTLMAVEEINSQNGVRGRPLELLVEDNQSGLRETASAFKKLNGARQLTALLGPNWVEFAEIAAYLAEKEQIVMLTASGYKKNTIEDNKFVFTTWPKHELTTKPLTDYLARRNHGNIAAVVTENAYYASVFSDMKLQLQTAGIKVAQEMHFQPSVQDYRSAISKFKQSRIDAVLVFLLENGETSSFLKQMKEMAFAAQAYGTYGIQFDTGVVSTPAVAEGVIFFDIRNSSSRDFVKRYEARFGEPPIASSSLAYDNVYVLKEAIERCGIESERIRHCLNTESFDGVTGRIAFDEYGNIRGREKISQLKIVKDGSFMLLTEIE